MINYSVVLSAIQITENSFCSYPVKICGDSECCESFPIANTRSSLDPMFKYVVKLV